MMTTDTTHKLASREVKIGSRTFRITGMAKGAAMIGPNMATMLGLILTDAAIAAADLQRMLSAVVDDTFNCISVEGHTSTNDTVLLLANGAAGGANLTADELPVFHATLHEVAAELAKSIPYDGEGVTHVIRIDVQGCESAAAARQIAKTVANSALVKTAVAGADPNWGRIVSAAGYAEVPFDPAGVDLEVNGFPLYQAGAPLAFEAAAVSASIKDNRETHILLTFGEGEAAVRFWTTDLTADYVRLNADYHT
jgi:glutamate N-acetyltransferase/amino-acid N-acetyltransferase